MSKGLEALEILVQNIEVEADWGEYQKVKHAHENLKKELTAFEIVKKYIDVDNLKGLTDEQRKLLKEVL